MKKIKEKWPIFVIAAIFSSLAVAVIIPLRVHFPAEISRDRYYIIVSQCIAAAAVVIVLLWQQYMHKKEMEAQRKEHVAEIERKEKISARPVLDVRYLYRCVTYDDVRELEELRRKMPRVWHSAILDDHGDYPTCFTIKLLTPLVRQCAFKLTIKGEELPRLSYSFGVLLQKYEWIIPLAHPNEEEYSTPIETENPFCIEVSCFSSKGEKINHEFKFENTLKQPMDIGWRIRNEDMIESMYVLDSGTDKVIETIFKDASGPLIDRDA